MPSQTALITGASSGIGRELARIHAASGGDLVLIARREEALADLKRELEGERGVRVLCLAIDLTESGAVDRVMAALEEHEVSIEILINNAGFGGHGLFHERPWAEEESMIELNITALCQLTHALLPQMVGRQSGRILNVASTAGFLPGPLQAVYYATKAFVLSFSQAIAEELRRDGITVTALCPGPVDTGFAERAGVEDVESFRHAVTPRGVAEVGYRTMLRGKLVAINDWKLSFLLNWVIPFLPRWTVLKLSRRSMEKS